MDEGTKYHNDPEAIVSFATAKERTLVNDKYYNDSVTIGYEGDRIIVKEWEEAFDKIEPSLDLVGTTLDPIMVKGIALSWKFQTNGVFLKIEESGKDTVRIKWFLNSKWNAWTHRIRILRSEQKLHEACSNYTKTTDKYASWGETDYFLSDWIQNKDSAEHEYNFYKNKMEEEGEEEDDGDYKARWEGGKDIPFLTPEEAMLYNAMEPTWEKVFGKKQGGLPPLWKLAAVGKRRLSMSQEAILRTLAEKDRPLTTYTVEDETFIWFNWDELTDHEATLPYFGRVSCIRAPSNVEVRFMSSSVSPQSVVLMCKMLEDGYFSYRKKAELREDDIDDLSDLNVHNGIVTSSADPDWNDSLQKSVALSKGEDPTATVVLNLQDIPLRWVYAGVWSDEGLTEPQKAMLKGMSVATSGDLIVNKFPAMRVKAADIQKLSNEPTATLWDVRDKKLVLGRLPCIWSRKILKVAKQVSFVQSNCLATWDGTTRLITTYSDIEAAITWSREKTGLYGLPDGRIVGVAAPMTNDPIAAFIEVAGSCRPVKTVALACIPDDDMRAGLKLHDNYKTIKICAGTVEKHVPLPVLLDKVTPIDCTRIIILKGIPHQIGKQFISKFAPGTFQIVSKETFGSKTDWDTHAIIKTFKTDDGQSVGAKALMAKRWEVISTLELVLQDRTHSQYTSLKLALGRMIDLASALEGS